MGFIQKILLGAAATAVVANVYGNTAPSLANLATPLNVNEIVTLPAFDDLASRVAETEADPRAGLLIGLNRQVDLDFSSVEPQPLNNGNWLWRLAVTSAEATSTSLHFDNFNLPADAKAWIYSGDRTSVHGPYTHQNINDYGEFWSPYVIGDTVIVEVEQASNEAPPLRIAHVGHGTKTWWQNDDEIQHKDAGSCHVNVSCSAGNGHSTKIRATARLVYNTLFQSFLCTGTLLNNTNQDGKPYFLTANHCIDSDSQAVSSTTYWEYESPSCGSNQAPTIDQTVSGASLRATWATNDFSLLELSAAPPASYTPYWSGWDRRDTVHQSGVSVHHPAGDVKKISIDSDPMLILNGSANPGDATNANGLYVHVERWEVGVTEGGSSGSGIWAPNNNLVGQLSAGSADCDNLNGQDFYGWIGQAWEGGGSSNSRLKDWLDPTGSGATTFSGCDHHNENCNSGGSANPGGSGNGGGGSNPLWLLIVLAVLGLYRNTFQRQQM